MKIINKEEIQDKLFGMIIDFEKSMNQYQTDVYAYVDEKGRVELDTFVNVGGNSWVNDDHITIYRDKQHCEDGFSYCEYISDIAYFAGLTVQVLKEKTYNLDPDCYNSVDDVTYLDIENFIRDDATLFDIFTENVKKQIPDMEAVQNFARAQAGLAIEILENM